MRKYSILDCQELARTRGGECLSKEIVNVSSRLIWKCQNGHIWEQRFHNVRRGSWCPECAKKERGLNRRLTLDQINNRIKNRGGRCIAHYPDQKSIWECSEGHRWKAMTTAVLGSKNRPGTWCPTCNGNPVITHATMVEIASQHGGECLSLEYQTAKDKYKWRCSHGHEFSATWDSVNRGSWCPSCAGKNRTMQDIQDIATQKGGICLSGDFNKTTDQLWWKCNSGHTWKASIASVLRGSWCPACKSYYTEEKCRFIIEQLSGFNFPKKRIRVYGEDLFKRYMELDGYCSETKTAFEHHGIQHYKRVNRFHKNPDDFRIQKLKDERKIEICRQKGIHLIVISHTVSDQGNDLLVDYIARKLGVYNAKVDFEQFSINSVLVVLKLIADARGGKCLSDSYCGPHFKLKWKCSCGHCWKATPASVKNNETWCPRCGAVNSGLKRRKYSIDDFTEIAAMHGGKCLSKEYHLTTDRLKWECREGHQWESVASSALRGHWCPKCRNHCT